MKNFLIGLAAICILTGCGGDPTPTPDLVSTQVAVEKAAAATLTAEAPTATSTPAPTDVPTSTPEATHTPTVPATDTPTATPTPEPTSTPTPTPATVMIPERWKPYDHFSGTFSMAHPQDWRVMDEDANSVEFQVGGLAGIRLGVYPAECEIASGDDADQMQKCLATYVASVVSQLGEFKLVQTNSWDDGVHQGYSVEATLEGYSGDSHQYGIWGFMPIADDPSQMLGAIFQTSGLASVRPPTTRERWQLERVLNTMRPESFSGADVELETTGVLIDTRQEEQRGIDTSLPFLQTVAGGQSHELFRLRGEVVNPTDMSLSNVRVVGRFYDAQGDLVTIDKSAPVVFPLEAGEAAPFLFLIWDLMPIEQYELSLEYSTSPDERLQLEIVEQGTEERIFWDHVIVGSVRNPYDFALWWPELYATCYDSDGQIIAVDEERLEPYELQPGATTPFEMLMYTWEKEVESCRLQTQAYRE